MSDLTLRDSFELAGEWYLPQCPDKKAAGNLRYSPTRIELNINETFQPFFKIASNGTTPETYPAVYGTTTTGQAVTILKAQTSNISLNIGPAGMRRPEVLISPWLLIGGHIPPDFLYNRIRVRIPGLEAWLSHPIIEQIFEIFEGSANYQTYHINPKKPEKIKIKTIDALLEWDISSSVKCNIFSSVEVNISTWVTIKPKQPQLLFWYFEQLSKFTNFLTLLAGDSVSADSIEAYPNKTKDKISVMVALQNNGYCTFRHPTNFFISKSIMGIDLSSALNNWFEIFPKIKTPVQLALSILETKKLWPYVKFLSLMQALEGFHRALYDGAYTTEDNYKKIKDSLFKAIPAELASDHKDSLKSRIKYGNQISLGKRLDHLAKLLSESLRKAIIGGNGKIPRSWIDTRNYYTHWDEDLKSNIINESELYYANDRLNIFLRVLYIILIIKIPEEAILKSIQANTNYISRELAQINAIKPPEK